MRRSSLVALGALALACVGPKTINPPPRSPPALTERSGLELHDAGGRPRLVVVRREGDPASALAIQVKLGDASDAPLRAAITSALSASRLEKSGATGVEQLPGFATARVRGL